jgi:thioredoxin reductase
MKRSIYDCVIVGGGPAGLSAALILGRCRRSVLLCDSGQPRNARARELHGFLTRDCTPPLELLQIGREQLQRYPTVEYQQTVVVDGRCEDRHFELRLEGGERVTCRKLLLATGVIDELPEVEGLRELYGRSVFHCPYCDGWEHRDLPLAVYGKGKSGAGLSLTLSLWSKDLVLCTDGPGRIPAGDKARLKARGVSVRSERIVRLEGQDGILQRIVFAGGETLPRRAMFVSGKQQQHSDLAARLGCAISPKRSVETGKLEMTSIPGLYVAGDASRDVQLAVVAAAEGTRAAFAINKALLEEELKGL